MEIASIRMGLYIFFVSVFLIHCDQVDSQQAVFSAKKQGPPKKTQTTVYETMFEEVKANAFFINPQLAKEKWGNQKFDAEKYKNGDEKTKASMIADLVESKILIGTSVSDLTTLLGRKNGYFFDESYPAFIFIVGSPPKKIEKNSFNEDTWQIVCLLNKDQKVSEVLIHRQ
jgi:hypothetical protein